MKIILSIVFYLLSLACFSQTVVTRTGSSTVPVDVRLMTQKNFYLPRVPCGGSLQGGVDTLGALVYSRCDSSVYVYNKGGNWTKLISYLPVETLQTITERGDTTNGYINITGNARYGLNNTEGLMLSYNKDDSTSYIQSFNDVSGKFHPIRIDGYVGESGGSTYHANSLKISDDLYYNNQLVNYIVLPTVLSSGGNYSVTPVNGSVYLVDQSVVSGQFHITTTSLINGAVINIKRTDGGANNTQISLVGGGTIDGSASLTISVRQNARLLFYNGNMYVL